MRLSHVPTSGGALGSSRGLLAPHPPPERARGGSGRGRTLSFPDTRLLQLFQTIALKGLASLHEFHSVRFDFTFHGGRHRPPSTEDLLTAWGFDQNLYYMFKHLEPEQNIIT
eukprot:1750704-Pyramimonas_sp.AAC.2